jgi:Zn-dependent protease with chaperone function
MSVLTASIDRPALAARRRLSLARLLVEGLAVGASVFVIARLVMTWRVSPAAASHSVEILGQRLSYPVANLDAVIVSLLASLGLAVTALCVLGAVAELRADRRFRRRLASMELDELDGAWLIRDTRPRAFCAGLVRPRVYISTAAVSLLDAPALEAVLAHEAHHARRRDPLRMAAARVLARACFFVPGVAELGRHDHTLAELGADEAALVAVPAGRAALARAMLAFHDAPGDEGAGGVDPVRVDYVLGTFPGWAFPIAPFLGALTVLLALLAVAVLAGQAAAGSATLAPPLLSRQPCVTMLALIPALGGWAAVRAARSRARSRRRPS